MTKGCLTFVLLNILCSEPFSALLVNQFPKFKITEKIQLLKIVEGYFSPPLKLKLHIKIISPKISRSRIFANYPKTILTTKTLISCSQRLLHGIHTRISSQAQTLAFYHFKRLCEFEEKFEYNLGGELGGVRR
jgi:hypothetical protein